MFGLSFDFIASRFRSNILNLFDVNGYILFNELSDVVFYNVCTTLLFMIFIIFSITPIFWLGINAPYDKQYNKKAFQNIHVYNIRCSKEKVSDPKKIGSQTA